MTTTGVHSVYDILSGLDRVAAERSKVSIGDAIEAFGRRSYGPLLILPAALEISPIGGIPGIPTFLALIIAIVSVQIMIGRDHVALPGLIERRRLSSRKVSDAADALQPLARRLDRWFHGRMRSMVRPGTMRIAAGVCILLTLTVPPLELIPFASTIPMAAILLFGVAITVRDGLLMTVAMAVSAMALTGAGYLIVTKILM
ncbi:exopolysaccharide biosynthesis protein [Parvularcula sp. LCG005]|uniref:exopolysaccharide biosynthesis protein n=1 Tax=Parvularcula sp. LCG005 TaxID=3078805 RepID=UPI002943109B|nr:exopolysaccharide biosynthesis protein [Parvularcula sp. LCG005]WOI54059.1 exopolysaccharide biosynthesis protein [Parvularcula sp. LCG005]